VTILVTGAAGFIGFHTAKRLVEEGKRVIGLDNFSPYYSVSLKRDRARELQKYGILVCEASVQDGIRQLVEKEQVTHIIHLAAQAGVRYSLQDPDAYIRSNIDGFLSVLETVRTHPYIVTVWASSSSVYGLNPTTPFSEKDRTDSPANLYGATKKANEAMAHAYHHLFGVVLRGLRFFTVYGPWGRPDMAYFLFADKIMKGETIEVYGQGRFRRDFTYIDDIVDGICGALEGSNPYAIYNLGNSHPEKVEELIACLESSLGKKAKIKFVDGPPGEIDETWADLQLSKQELGFSPKISLSEGINRFCDWYCSYYC